MPRPGMHDVVSAAWQLNSDATTWLADLAEVGARLGGDAIGALAWRAELDDDGEANVMGVEGARGLAEWMMSDHEGGLSSDELRGAYATPRMVATMRQIFSGPAQAASTPRSEAGEVPEALRRELRQRDMIDALTVAPRAGRQVVTLAIPLLRTARTKSSSVDEMDALTRRWRGVALHLRSALAMRQRLCDGGSASFSNPEVLADFDQRGRGSFEHPHMRESLLEQAKWTAGNEGVPWVWNDLVAGRYSIVSYRERSGGVRFLAVQNPALDGRIRALSDAERAVIERLCRGASHKAIAFDLGVRASSVANIARRAMTKLGVSSRAQLAALYLALVPAT